MVQGHARDMVGAQLSVCPLPTGACLISSLSADQQCAASASNATATQLNCRVTESIPNSSSLHVSVRLPETTREGDKYQVLMKAPGGTRLFDYQAQVLTETPDDEGDCGSCPKRKLHPVGPAAPASP